jgi:hypothetical protein
VYPKYASVLPGFVLESVASGAEPEVSDVSIKFGLDQAEARSLLGAINFLGVILSAPGEQEDESKMSDGMLAAEIISKDAQVTVVSLLNELQRERSTVAGAFRRAALAHRLLPTLIDLELMVDVRMDFDKDQIALAVPVVLMHIDTDAADQEIWLQMNKGQLHKAIEDLKKTLARLEAAERWIQGRSS